MGYGKQGQSQTFAKNLFFTLLLAGVWPLLIGCEKIQLDERVSQLCRQDGGVRVYETVKLSAGEFDRYGVVRVPREKDAKGMDAYFYEQDVHYYLKGNPELWRLNFRIVRRADKKVLGEATSYARSGGDLPGPWHESSFGCPERSDISDLKRQVFVLEQ